MDVKERVRGKYGEAALRVKAGGSSRCSPARGSAGSVDPITSNLYGSSQTSVIPEEAVLASLGCGNPTALAKRVINLSAGVVTRGQAPADVEPTRVYNVEDARAFLTRQGVDVDAIAPQVEGEFVSAFIRAVKPASKECCGPACCS